MNLYNIYEDAEVLDLSSYSELTEYSPSNIRHTLRMERKVEVNFENIKAIIFPKSCKKVCKKMSGYKFVDAFPNVKEVIWPEFIRIPKGFFEGSKIEQIQINKCKNIGRMAFAYSCLTYFKFPENLKNLDASAFTAATDLIEVDFAHINIKIPSKCFFECCSLSSIVNIENITSIGPEAFELTALNHLTIPKSVTMLGSESFKSCKSLETVCFEGNSCYLMDAVFCNDIELTEVILPSKLSSIGYCAFKNTKLKTIKIPDSVESVGIGAFKDCQCLENVIWSNSCKCIDSFTFADCTKLKKLENTENVDTLIGTAFNRAPCELSIPNVTKIDAEDMEFCGTLNLSCSVILESDVLYPKVLRKQKGITLPYFWD